VKETTAAFLLCNQNKRLVTLGLQSIISRKVCAS